MSTNKYISSFACNDKIMRCFHNELIDSDKYYAYAKTLPNNASKNAALSKYVCGTSNGVITECCDPNNPNANIINPDGKLIKVIKDIDDNIIEYRICNCSNSKCEQSKCSDFKKPTYYESCKIRSIDPKNTVKVSYFENKILPANAYPDCFSKC